METITHMLVGYMHDCWRLSEVRTPVVAGWMCVFIKSHGAMSPRSYAQCSAQTPKTATLS